MDMSGLPQLAEWQRPASGYICATQVVYEYQGEMWRRDCGTCPRCVARKKRDTTGRAAAEAVDSAEVMVWTLTYRDGNPGAVDFVTKDRQDFLKRLRQHLWREARQKVGAPKRYRGASEHVRLWYEGQKGRCSEAERLTRWQGKIWEVCPRVRYMGCGERGKRNTKRCHWHLCLFLTKPSGFVSTPKQPNGKPGRENHDLWPWGFVNIDVMPEEMSRKVKAVRYAVKYLDKARSPKIDGMRRGDKAEAKFFRSNRPGLGHAFLIEEAQRYAKAGLPIRGQYRVPGVIMSRQAYKPIRNRMGQVVGQRVLDRHAVHQLSGRMRGHFIEAYHAEWERLRPDIPVPMTEWLMRYSEYAIQGTGDIKAKLFDKPRAPVEPPQKIPPRRACRPVVIPVWGAGRYRGQVRGMVQLDWDGEATWTDTEGTEWPIPGPVAETIPDLTDKQAAFLDAKLSAARGPGWISERQRRQMIHDRGIRLTDSMRAWAKRGPNPMPPHLPPQEPVTAMLRKLNMMGYGHVPGTVAKSLKDGRDAPAFISRGSLARKPLKDREC